MEYVIEPEDLVRKLTAAIDAAQIDWEKNKLWTKKIKSTLQSILQCEVTEVIFTDAEKQISEFMLDLVAWNRENGEGIVLAAECEWNTKPQEIVKDFEKLLVMKSSTKLMIFASSGKIPNQQLILEALKKSFFGYKHHVAGERYVFVDFARTPDRMGFWFVISKDGLVESLAPVNQIDLGNGLDNGRTIALLSAFCTPSTPMA
jgi:hypothetical protein